MTHVADETKTNKFFRFLHGVSERALKGSLDVEQFTAVAQVLLDKGARAKNLLEYVANGCPKVDYTKSTPKAKVGKGQKPKTVDLSDFFVTSDRLYVDPDFLARIDVTSCVEDMRELSVKFVLPRNMSDSENAKAVGGMAALTAMRPSPYQLKRELALALEGKSKLFIKGNWYLLYMEGRDGTLCPVSVRWVGGRLRLLCYRFGGGGGWYEGDRVCGN